MASFEPLYCCRGILQCVQFLACPVESVERLPKWLRELKIVCVGLEVAKRRLIVVMSRQPKPRLGGDNCSSRTKVVWRNSLAFLPRCISRNSLFNTFADAVFVS